MCPAKQSLSLAGYHALSYAFQCVDGGDLDDRDESASHEAACLSMTAKFVLKKLHYKHISG